MRVKLLILSLFTALSVFIVGCISNDIPYPVIELSINKIEGEGFTSYIDISTRTVELELEEQTNRAAVEISAAEITDQATSTVDLVGTFDLRNPLEVTLSLYDDYLWTIEASQEIERYFNVDGQIGSSVIDEVNRTATAYVSMTTDLSKIFVKELKLGPADITELDSDVMGEQSFESVRYADISYHGNNYRWLLYVYQTDATIDFTTCDLWSKVAWLTASGDVSGSYGFRYRKTGETVWTEVTDDQLTTNGGEFSAKVSDLDSETSYEFVAFSGDDVSAVIEKTSDAETQLPNSGLENWHKPAKYWLPYEEDGTEFWATGNKGATTLSESDNISYPSTDVSPYSGGSLSACLESRWIILKFAAGNLFTGTYVATKSTNGIIAFGQPFTTRPQALKLKVKYNSGIINRVSEVPSGVTVVSGETPDIGSIFIALGTWTPEEYGYSSYESEMQGTATSPIVIDTRDKTTFFNSRADAVVAYGEQNFTESVTEWTEVTIPIDYNSTSIVPTHIVVVCSSSKYGDYFTGSDSSMMWVDDIELVY